MALNTSWMILHIKFPIMLQVMICLSAILPSPPFWWSPCSVPICHALVLSWGKIQPQLGICCCPVICCRLMSYIQPISKNFTKPFAHIICTMFFPQHQLQSSLFVWIVTSIILSYLSCAKPTLLKDNVCPCVTHQSVIIVHCRFSDKTFKWD